MDVSLAQVAAAAAFYLAYAVVAGILALKWLMRQADVSWRERVSLSLTQTVTIAAVIGVIRSAVALWWQAAAMAEVPVTEALDAFLLMSKTTAYGRAGLAAIVLFAYLGFANRIMNPANPSVTQLVLVSILLAALGVARVAGGHAAEDGVVSLAFWVEWLHLTAMSLWVGIVLVGAWLVMPYARLDGLDKWTATSRLLTMVSSLATVVLAVIVATGLYNAYRTMGAVTPLWTTAYGAVLSAKLAKVVLAMLLGGYNRVIGFPAVTRASSHHAVPVGAMKRLVLVLKIESVALVAAVIAASVLVGMAPPGGH